MASDEKKSSNEPADMPEKISKESNAADEAKSLKQPKDRSFVDELGVEDLTDVLFGSRGKIFSAAGRDAPVAQVDDTGVLLRPAHRPYTEGAQEEILINVDDRGILLNEFGEPRKIIGAKFKGKPIYTLGEKKPGTLKHYCAWFDEDWRAHKFYVKEDTLTVDMIYRLRNKTHDGEISIFPTIRTDP